MDPLAPTSTSSLGDGLVRQYSLCSDPADSRVIRVGCSGRRQPGGSAYVHEQVTVGSTVRVRGPRNHFSFVASPRYVFVAGGIGITPCSR